MKQFKYFLFISLLLSTLQISAGTPTANCPEKLSLDKGWRFFLGDIPFPVITGHGMSYSSAKAGKAWGAAAPEYDDTNWRIVNLPHDWSVEQPYDSTENLSQGYRKRGIGWYRRNFKLSLSDKGKHLEIRFDGIATNCTVWVNGTVVNRNFCGYNSIYIDITPFAYYGETLNNIAVRVDAVQQEGWWYEGAGIYRHTWLVKRSPLHIITDGVYAQPVKTASGEWNIPAEVTLENSGEQNKDAEVEVSLWNTNGKQIAIQKNTANVAFLDQSTVKLNVPVSHPELWTLEKPTLYKVKTTVREKGVLVDSLWTTCGFRTIKFTVDSGFYLNEKRVKIKGVCNHQDHAGVGVAVPDKLWEFRLRKLKEMGVNGYRCSHNPPAAEFLDACDRMGILVMDENRNFNVSPEYTRQLEWMVRRDRNHPSVILWSVFNEEPMQGTENGYEMVRRMSAEVKKLDTTRPVTAAASGGLTTPKNVGFAVDVIGMNYQVNNYDNVHKYFPNTPITSSEDASAYMVRGEYVTDTKKCLHDSYDTQNARWGTNNHTGWKLVDERPFIAGCFIWTGFDYRGEPQPYSWPAAGASFGLMDQCGFPKFAYYIRQAQWLQKPVLQLVPHWNWPTEMIGKPVKVMAATNVERVKLILNGKEVGDKKVDKYEMADWMIPYQPGKLVAIGYNGTKEVARFTVETTGEPVALQLIPDRKSMVNDGLDAMPVTVQAIDSKGRAVPTSNISIEFEVSGSGSIIGLGNGNPNSHEAEKGKTRKLFNGLAQVILQTNQTAGILTLTATAKGLKPAIISIPVNDTIQTPEIPSAKPVLILNKWRVSPVYASKPNATQDIADYDMNTWTNSNGLNPTTFTETGYSIYRSNFKPFVAQQTNGGQIVFKNIVGKAEFWLDKTLVATKLTPEKKDITIEFPPKKSEFKLSIVFEAGKNEKAGVAGVVSVGEKE